MSEPKPTYITTADLAAFASVLLERSQLAASLGKQFDGDRDLYKVLGYPASISFDKYKGRYKRGHIAGRIVRRPAADTWRSQAVLLDGDAVSGTPFLDDWAALEKRLHIWRRLSILDTQAGIGQYGALLFGFAGGGKLSDPIGPGSQQGVEGLLYLRVLDEGNAAISGYVADSSNPRFGLPEWYDVRLNDQGTHRVHWSRILHVAEDSIDDVFGVPRLQDVWNLLDDLDKIIGGGAEATWKLMRKGYGFDVKPEYELPAAAEEAMKDQIEEMEHGLRRYVLTRGVTAYDLGSEVVDPTGLFNAIIALVAGTKGIPQRQLLGSERGELASSQDESNWAGVVEARREQHAEPNILRPFIDRLLWAGVLSQPTSPDGYTVQWQTLFTLTEGEEAVIANDYANALQALVAAGMTLDEALSFLRSMPDPARFERQAGLQAARRIAARASRLQGNEKRTALDAAAEMQAASEILADVLRLEAMEEDDDDA